MELGTDFVTPDKRISDNDFRASHRTPGGDQGEGSMSDGWTWVAALLVAALFIVSGYLDQESGIQHASANGPAQSFASSSPGSSASVGGGESYQSEKGY
ncbi:MAG: hypothetical protein ABI905_06585 [Betaproteobacteria bacterium]